jgi:hypothetical protein
MSIRLVMGLCICIKKIVRSSRFYSVYSRSIRAIDQLLLFFFCSECFVFVYAKGVLDSFDSIRHLSLNLGPKKNCSHLLCTLLVYARVHLPLFFGLDNISELTPTQPNPLLFPRPPSHDQKRNLFSEVETSVQIDI